VQRAWSERSEVFLAAGNLAGGAGGHPDKIATIDPATCGGSHPATASVGAAHDGPPWIYGKPDARFTVVEYADLECPYCRAYFPVLKHWIDANPDVNWQWHHLPLSIHEPAATSEARLAECVGETGDSAGVLAGG
jgi:protein-disulfide isomerase